MTGEQYEKLLEDIRNEKGSVARAMEQLQLEQAHLGRLLDRLDREERRVARQALTSTHSASRKLVVSE